MATILIVEDNVANMTLAVCLLDSQGHTVLSATDAAAGCDGYIAKPMRYQEFLATVVTQLARI